MWTMNVRKAIAVARSMAAWGLLAAALLIGHGIGSELDDLRTKAEQGDAAAQRELGTRYLEGKGVDRNAQEAIKWLQKASEQGNAKAQFCLGDCYQKGDGVEKDPDEAAKWYAKSMIGLQKETEQGDVNCALNQDQKIDYLTGSPKTSCGVSASGANTAAGVAKAGVDPLAAPRPPTSPKYTSSGVR